MPDLIPRRRVLAGLSLLGLARPAAAQEPQPCEQIDDLGGWSVTATQSSLVMFGDALQWEMIGAPQSAVKPVRLDFLGSPVSRAGVRDSVVIMELYLPVFDVTLPPDDFQLAAFAADDSRVALGLSGAVVSFNYAIGLVIGDEVITVEAKQHTPSLSTPPYAYFRFEAGEASRLIDALINDVPIRVQLELPQTQPGLPNVVVAGAWMTGRGSFGDAVDWGLAGIARQRNLPEDERCVPEACYVTTACVGAVGLADDCWEMTTLRAFRDGPLTGSDGGPGQIAEYYARAPDVVAAIHARPDARRIWLATYFTGVLPAALAAKAGRTRLARAVYVRQVRRLERLAEDAERTGAG